MTKNMIDVNSDIGVFTISHAVVIIDMIGYGSQIALSYTRNRDIPSSCKTENLPGTRAMLSKRAVMSQVKQGQIYRAEPPLPAVRFQGKMDPNAR